MNESCIDLHIHTTASDGSFTPIEIVELAKKANLKAIAITDHDSIDGLLKLKGLYDTKQLEIISGIELSVEFEAEMHLLGYFVDINSNEFKQDIRKIKSKRFSEVRSFFSNLDALNINISPEDVIKSYANLSKYSMASYLVNNGYVSNICDAYKMFLHKTELQIKKMLSPYEGINIIKKAGGLCFLAHPNSLKKNREQLESIIDDLVAHGLDGIECYHSQYSVENEKMYLDIAKKRGLLASGGSDFHGKMKPEIQLGRGYGNLNISYDIIRKMKTHMSKK